MFGMACWLILGAAFSAGFGVLLHDGWSRKSSIAGGVSYFLSWCIAAVLISNQDYNIHLLGLLVLTGLGVILIVLEFSNPLTPFRGTRGTRGV